MKKSIFLILFVLFIKSLVSAQGIVVDSLGVAINETENSANASAILDVQSDNTGVLIPRMDSINMNGIASPATGLIVYCTTNDAFHYFDGGSWEPLARLAEVPEIPYDEDTDKTNELLSSYNHDTDLLKLLEGTNQLDVNLNDINRFGFDKGKNVLYAQKYLNDPANIAMGDSEVDRLSSSGFFPDQYPKVDITTGKSDSQKFYELVSINHRKCNGDKIERRLGLEFALGADGTPDAMKAGGMFLESVQPYGEYPELTMFVQKHRAISIVSGPKFKYPHVGIHTNNPSFPFFVNGQAGGTTGWKQYSDSTLKTNVTTIDSALNIVSNMRGVTFEWKADTVFSRPEGQQVGFIAQELKPYLPQVVSDTSQMNPYMTVSYSNIVPILAQGIKELKDEKDAELAALEGEIEELQEAVQELQELVGEQSE